MKLERLQLTNFRGFESLDITFDPQFTVILGANMSGKSAVLRAVEIWAEEWLGAIVDLNVVPRLPAEIRRVTRATAGTSDLVFQLPARVSGNALASSSTFLWSLEVAVDGKHRAGGPRFYDVYPDQRGAELNPWPVIASYSAQRGWPAASTLDELPGIGSRHDGYRKCLNIVSSYGALAAWIRRQTLIQLQRGGGYQQPQLAAIEAGIACCFEDVSRFWFDVQYEELRFERRTGDIQSFSMLSDGYRNTIALIADLAWRAAVLNPQHGANAHLLTEGIVVIDELELHLHPKWQRRIVDDLRRTFPKMQFVVTTHSPQVVASVSRNQVRLLSENRLVASELFVEGRDTNALLEDIFDVPARPQHVETELHEIYRLLEDEQYADARARIAKLEDQLGPDDAAVIKINWLLATDDPQPIPQAASAP